ncbi:CCAAT/enhancer-binding protein zeta-like [Argonauta hians]
MSEKVKKKKASKQSQKQKIMDESESDDGIFNDVQHYIKSLGLNNDTTASATKVASSQPLPDDFNWGGMIPNKSVSSKPSVSETKKEHADTSKDVSEIKVPSKKKSKNKYKPQVDDGVVKSYEYSLKEVQDNNISSTTKEKKQDKGTKKNSTKLVIEEGYVWYESDEEDDSKSASITKNTKGTSVQSLESEAAEILQKDVENYKNRRNRKSPSETSWFEKVISSGTLSDKEAAFQLCVTQSPVHNIDALDNLIAMTQKKSRHVNIKASLVLKDLFIKYILPKAKPLLTFAQHTDEELNKSNRNKKLALWYFESELKKRFAIFTESLVNLLRDNVDASKEKVLNITSEILAYTPEQETVLLSAVVNKIGDPSYKIASKTIYILGKFLKVCPSKKLKVIDEVEMLLCRTGMKDRGIYYAFCFLSNLRLKEGESKIAEKLVTVYLKFFQKFIQKGEMDNRMLSAILCGINFAFKIIFEKREFIKEHAEILFKTVHMVNFNTSLQVLMLLYQIMEADTLSDRFYMVLYRKMCDPTLKISNRHMHFLNLVFRAIKQDHSEGRIKAFIKRLLQVCFYLSPPFICGALCLLSEVFREKPTLFNLRQNAQDFVESDEEECYKDVQLEDETELMKQTELDSKSADDEEQEDNTPKKVSSWIHRKNLKYVPVNAGYSPHHRNPLYCQAETTLFWELSLLSSHFHPTVSLYASTLLNNKFIEHEGNPLQDYTLIRFLDRFVFKNPKQVTEKSSEPKKNRYNPKGIKLIPANDKKYLEKPNKIPVEEQYLYQYFLHRKAVECDKGIFSEDEEVSDDEFDQILNQYEKTVDDRELNDFDFYGELGKQTGHKRSLKSDFSSSEESDEESDEEVDFGEDFMTEFKEFEDSDENDNCEFDEENVKFSDDSDGDDDNDSFREPKLKKLKRLKKESEKNPHDTSKFFAAAEEFSHMLEDNIMSNIGSSAVVNKDKSSAKQLKWELSKEKKDWKRNRSPKWKKKGKMETNIKFGKKPKGIQKKQKLKKRK